MATIGRILYLICVMVITTLWLVCISISSMWKFVHVGIREWSVEEGRAAWQGNLVTHFKAYLLGVELVSAYAEGMKNDEE
jgi:hypothetical protein